MVDRVDLTRRVSSWLLPLLLWSDSGWANIIGDEDGRRPITSAGRELGLSEEEIKQARGATGYIVCPGTDHGNTMVNSFALVERLDVGAGTAHAFADQDGRLRTPLEECHFRNQAQAFVQQKLSGAAGLYLGARSRMGASDPRDFSVARLEAQVEMAKPYLLHEVEPRSLIGMDVLAVTSYAASLNPDPQVPLIQACKIRDVRWFDAEPVGSFMLLTDCDTEPVASGSIVLGRFDGELRALGIITSGGKRELDGQEYDLSTGSYTSAIMFHGRFRDAVLGIAGTGRMPDGNAARE